MQSNDLLDQFLKKKKKDKTACESTIETWHYMMMHYGYFPFEDFLNMDAVLVSMLTGLLDEFNKKCGSPKTPGSGGKRLG